MRRNVTLLIVHCTGTPMNTPCGYKEINNYHLNVLGWKNGCGYHFIIRRNGSIENGRPLDMVGAHCYGHNKHSIGIVYEGGIDLDGKPADTRTPEQKQVMRRLLERLKKDYPKAIIVGHNTFSNKACPCFDAVKEYADLQPR